jgi:hypothetical protein
MTSLAEAENRFGTVVRGAGGAIFGVERSPSACNRQEEKLQIGTPDGFVRMAVLLNQPDIDAVLRERTVILVMHADQLRSPARRDLAGSFMLERVVSIRPRSF